MYTYIYIYTHTHIYVFMCIYIYIYIRDSICIYTYMCTYIYFLSLISICKVLENGFVKLFQRLILIKYLIPFVPSSFAQCCATQIYIASTWGGKREHVSVRDVEHIQLSDFFLLWDVSHYSTVMVEGFQFV